MFAAAVAIGVAVISLGQFEGSVLVSRGSPMQGRVLVVRAFVQSALAALGLIASAPIWRTVLGGDRAGAIAWLFVLVVTLEVMSLLLRGINLGQHHVVAYNLVSLVQRLGYLGVIGAMSVAVGLRLERVLAAWSVATFVSVGISAVWAWARSPGNGLTPHRLLQGWVPAAARGVRAFFTIVLTVALVRCDIWMLGLMIDVEAVGQISVASYLAEWLWYVPSILGNVLFAAVSVEGSDRALARIGPASRAVVGLVVPVGLVLALAGRWVVPTLYGGAYDRAGLLFVLLVPGMAAIAVHLVVDSFFTSRGFPAICVWAAAGALITKVALNLLVVPAFGAEGAAATTTVVYVGLLTVKVAAIRRVTGVPVGELLRPRWGEVRSHLKGGRAWVSEWLRTGMHIIR